MAKQKKTGKRRSSPRHHKAHKGHKGGRRRGHRKGGMSVVQKAAIAIVALGVAGEVLSPFLPDKVAEYASPLAIAGGGLLLHKGNMSKAAPFLLVGATAGAVQLISQTKVITDARDKVLAIKESSETPKLSAVK